MKYNTDADALGVRMLMRAYRLWPHITVGASTIIDFAFRYAEYGFCAYRFASRRGMPCSRWLQKKRQIPRNSIISMSSIHNVIISLSSSLRMTMPASGYGRLCGEK